MYQNSDANFIEKGLSYYYTNYYSTWSHFIDIHTYSNTTTKLFTAPNTGFILNNNDDHYTYNPINTFDSTYTQTNNTIELSFNISYLNLQKCIFQLLSKILLNLDKIVYQYPLVMPYH